MLIVGATGILRPAVLSLAAAGWMVAAVARQHDRLDVLAADAGPGVIPLSVDVYDAGAVADVLGTAPSFDAAILYLAEADDDRENAAADRLSRVVRGIKVVRGNAVVRSNTVVRGTTVRILTSRWTPTTSPELTTGRWPRRPGRSHLLLGVGSDAGGARWHTPEEISRAAIEVLRSGSDAVLGNPMHLRP